MTVDVVRRPVQSRWRIVWAIARRELRDTLRDWRIIFPIVGLTLLFPWLMNWTAQTAVEFVQRQNADIIGERLIPFLLMVVGFFPMSFSLVIALETFVGEKERRSIEPLLSMPITDLELYLGKMIAATALPLIVAITEIAKDNGRIHTNNAVALVGAGMISVLVFPTLGLAIKGGREEVETVEEMTGVIDG